MRNVEVLPFERDIDVCQERGRLACSCKKRVNLEEMPTREAVTRYRTMKTGEKYLVTPWS